MADVLVIDTCGAAGYVAVFDAGQREPDVRCEEHLGVRATQEELLPKIAAVLERSGMALADLAAIAVVNGPGSFTGVRIGLAAAKGLCEASGVPLVTLSRLAVLADAVRAAPVWAFLQAGRDEVYAELFAFGSLAGVGHIVTNSSESLAVASVYPLERALELAGTDTIAVCEEPLRKEPLFKDVPRTVFVLPGEFEQSLRTAAAEAAREQRWADVALSDARYLRVPDAELALRAKQA